MSAAAPSPSGLLLAFFGDDFTGSTDALESLSRAGIRTMLFLEPPAPGQLAAYPDLEAVGVAGLTRSLTPESMRAVLQPAFESLRALRPRHVHYKVCSTFDSSPRVGSIGCAIDVGSAVFRGPFVPLVVGAPGLGRFCVFGNLFARYGIGSTGAIHRLDRHPSISRHPVTPMTEADLRLHLSRQTDKTIGLVDVLALDGSETEARAALDRALADGAGIVLFDALRPEHLARIGNLIDECAPADGALFSAGSSGVGTALGAHWQSVGRTHPVSAWPDPGPATPLLVVSGSCSPVTTGQIDWARDHGFATVPLEVSGIDPDDAPALIRKATEETLALLRSGRHVVAHTTGAGTARGPVSSELVGAILGAIARNTVERAGVRRVLFSGGDSSSYAARAVGIEAVEMIAPLAPGAPLCRVHAPATPSVHGLEVNFKGGQVGAPDYFAAVARGRL